MALQCGSTLQSRGDLFCSHAVVSLGGKYFGKVKHSSLLSPSCKKFYETGLAQMKKTETFLITSGETNGQMKKGIN